MEGITAELAKFVVKTGFDDLPEPVVQTTKRVLLDSIGCGLGGYVTDRAKIALELVEELGGKPQASIIGGGRTSYALAAFANGELINALDFDILGPKYGHVAPYALPSTLAMGERMSVSGKDLVTAVALALEVGGRTGSSLTQHMIPKAEAPYYEWTQRSSHTPAIFGGVAGAGKLLGLDEKRLANAFGIAGASTPVPAGLKWEHTAGPNIMTKYNCWSGWVSQLATVASLAAEKGFTGDTTILDGEWGFWRIIGSSPFKAENITNGLGKTWHIRQVLPGEHRPVIFKAYPCCGANHAFIDVIRKIINEEGVKPEDIEEVTIGGEPLMLTANRAGNEVKSFSDAQFVIAYSAAVAAYHGDKAGPFWQLPNTFNDPRIKKLMKKVKLVPHPRAEKLMASKIKAGQVPRFFDSTIEIVAKGRKFTAEAAAPRTTLSPVTDEELTAKFRNNAAYSSLKTGKVEESLEMLYKLETVDNVTELFKLLTVG